MLIHRYIKKNVLLYEEEELFKFFDEEFINNIRKWRIQNIKDKEEELQKFIEEDNR